MSSQRVPDEVREGLVAIQAVLPWDRELKRILAVLAQSDPNTRELKDAVESMKVLITAHDLADDVDAHTLPPEEIKRLWSSPRKAAMEAVERGEYRERRLLIEGKVAATNWWLGLMAFFASMTAVGLEVWRSLT